MKRSDLAALFCMLSRNRPEPRGPEFRGNSRERGARSPARGRQRFDTPFPGTRAAPAGGPGGRPRPRRAGGPGQAHERPRAATPAAGDLGPGGRPFRAGDPFGRATLSGGGPGRRTRAATRRAGDPGPGGRKPPRAVIRKEPDPAALFCAYRTKNAQD